MIPKAMSDFSILTEGFAEAAARAGRLARRDALAAGHSVVFVDSLGRYVEERPDGRRFEIRLESTHSREAHRVVQRELTSDAA